MQNSDATSPVSAPTPQVSSDNSASAQTATTPTQPAAVQASRPQMPIRQFDDKNADVHLNVDGSADSMKGSSMQGSSKIFIPLCVIVIVAGALTGIGLNKLKASSTDGNTTFEGKEIQKVAGDTVQNGQIFGSADAQTFKDSAEGYLVAGGIDGEGSHHLLRAGGVSQTVYLTSSVTDLSKFEGMNIKVWGETFKAQKAGWLMDVGRVQVTDTKGTAPTEK
jgi:hypothetical protein